jgi:hypothetical protein
MSKKSVRESQPKLSLSAKAAVTEHPAVIEPPAEQQLSKRKSKTMSLATKDAPVPGMKTVAVEPGSRPGITVTI